MDLSSFLTSFLATFALFVFFVFVFTWLSRKPGNMVIYYPIWINKGLLPPYDVRTRSPFAWIKESFTSTEEKIISNSGVDTAVYFVFLSTVLKIMVSSGTFLLPSLLPIAWTANGIFVKVNCFKINSNISNLERFSMANVEEKSPRLWAFLLATYVVSFTTFYMLWKAYNHVSELRGTALSAPDVIMPEQYAIVVRDIPAVPKTQKDRKEQVDSYFKSLYADEFYDSLVITDNTEVNIIWEDLTKYRNKLAHAEAKFAASKTRTRPTNKKYFIFGKKFDTIDYCNKMIATLVPKLKKEQQKTIRGKQKDSALIFFTNRKAATSAAQTIHAKKADTWTVGEAPEPRQMLWRNLGLEFYQWQLRQDIVYLIVALTILFYMIPITFITAFTTLEKLKIILPFMSPVVDKAMVKSVLEGSIPQIVLIAFMALLPKFLMFLSRTEGIPSVSRAVRASSGKHFYFIILNVFIGVTIGGTLFSTIKDLQKNPKQIWMLLGKSIPENATFFLSFVALKLFVGYGIELSRPFSFFMFYVNKRFFCRTAAEEKKAWAPGDMNYATRVPNDLLIVTIVLCYSVIAPVIILFGVAYFSLGWLVLRNQALNVYIPSYESYGRMWPHMHARILAALIIYQFTMIGAFSLKQFYYAPLVIPLPILSIAFAIVCRRKFYYSFCHTPLEVVCAEMRETPNLRAIYKEFIPPCLRSEYPDEEAQPVPDASSASLLQPPEYKDLIKSVEEKESQSLISNLWGPTPETEASNSV